MNTIVKTQFGKALSAFVIGVTFLGLAHASQPVLVDGALSTTVQFGDLNLDSTAGAKILYARLRQAARTVCTPFESISLEAIQKWQSCVGNAMSAAVARIDKPMVTQLHDNSAHRSRQSADADRAAVPPSLAKQ